MQIHQHWLNSATKTPSPNCDDFPAGNLPMLLVIHCISLPEGQFNTPYIDQLFTNQLTANHHPSFQSIYQLKVSSHVLIKRNGAITQYVPFNRRAWHAGHSCYQGQEKCNDFSLGIELEGTDSSPYTDIQYQHLAKLTTSLLKTYPTLSPQHITGHSDIAPRRKTDPGIYFDWNRLYKLIAIDKRD